MGAIVRSDFVVPYGSIVLDIFPVCISCIFSPPHTTACHFIRLSALSISVSFSSIFLFISFSGCIWFKDALEFMMYVCDKLQRASLNDPAGNPASVFTLSIEHRIECASSHQVRGEGRKRNA